MRRCALLRVAVSGDSCAVRCHLKHCCVFFRYEYAYVEKICLTMIWWWCAVVNSNLLCFEVFLLAQRSPAQRSCSLCMNTTIEIHTATLGAASVTSDNWQHYLSPIPAQRSVCVNGTLWLWIRRSLTHLGRLGPMQCTRISWKVVHMFTLVNDLSAAQFVTINVDGTVTSNDTCVVISRPSRIQ